MPGRRMFCTVMIVAIFWLLPGRATAMQQEGAIINPSVDAALNPGSMEGIVTNGITGAPLEGVEVATSHDAALFTTATGADGRFVFPSLPPGRYVVKATRDGLLVPTPSIPAQSRDTLVTVRAKEAARNVRIRLVEATTIAGRVLLDDRPAGSLLIQLLQRRYLMGIETLVDSGVIQSTDADGNYRLENVQPGRYYIVATPADTAVRFYFPNATSVDQSVPITVTGGMDLSGINFTLTSPQLHTVRLKLGGATLPSNQYEVSFQFHPVSGSGDNIDQPAVLNSWTMPDVDGIYTIERVPPGAYNIDIYWRASESRAQRPQNRSYRTRMRVLDRDVDLGTIDVPPPFSISGKITFSNVTAVPFNRVGVAALQPLSDIRERDVPVSEDGTFVFEEVAHNPLLLFVAGLPEDRYVSSVRYAGLDVLSSGIPIDGVDRGPMEIVISGPAGTVNGVLTDAKNDIVANTTVVLIPPANRRSNPTQFLTAITDSSGAFSIKQIPPGDYGLLAWESIPGDAFRNADFLKDYEPRAVKVQVLGGSTVLSNVKIIPR
jgi:hypothetical protein